jgi:hypothetical protein
VTHFNTRLADIMKRVAFGQYIGYEDIKWLCQQIDRLNAEVFEAETKINELQMWYSIANMSR